MFNQPPQFVITQVDARVTIPGVGLRSRPWGSAYILLASSRLLTALLLPLACFIPTGPTFCAAVARP